MKSSEICNMFRAAKDKRKQIRVLANMTDSDSETIIQVLKDHGLCVRYGKCARCGFDSMLYFTKYCTECEDAIALEKSLSAKVLSMSRKISALDAELKVLKGMIDG